MRKILKIMLGVVLMTTFLQSLQAQNNDKFKTVVFQTNGTCESCKKRIESNIAYAKGVKDVSYNLATSKVTIVYNPSKTNVQDLRFAIQKLGYTAKDCSTNQSKEIPQSQKNNSPKKD